MRGVAQTPEEPRVQQERAAGRLHRRDVKRTSRFLSFRSPPRTALARTARGRSRNRQRCSSRIRVERVVELEALYHRMTLIHRQRQDRDEFDATPRKLRIHAGQVGQT